MREVKTIDKVDSQMQTDELIRLRQRAGELGQTDVAGLLDEMIALRTEVDKQKALIASLQRDALTDTLTGLPNRRAFESELQRLLATARRHQRRHGLLMVDLNNFKHINDTYGHQAGDHVLMHVAQVLQENIRGTDLVARLGGDEFCVILNEVRSMEDAQRRAHQLEIILRNSPCRYEGHIFHPTASIGCHVFSGNDDAFEVLGRADSDMYAHKRQLA